MYIYIYIYIYIYYICIYIYNVYIQTNEMPPKFWVFLCNDFLFFQSDFQFFSFKRLQINFSNLLLERFPLHFCVFSYINLNKANTYVKTRWGLVEITDYSIKKLLVRLFQGAYFPINISNILILKNILYTALNLLKKFSRLFIQVDCSRFSLSWIEAQKNIWLIKFTTNLNGATKLYFRHYACAVIILFNTGLYKSIFSTYSFGN